MELKSCPFCGDKNPQVVRLWQAFDLGELHPDRNEYLVRCEWCGSCGEQCCNHTSAVKAWNTRKEPE